MPGGHPLCALPSAPAGGASLDSSARQRGDIALKSRQIAALRKPANSHLSFDGAKERCAKESSRSGAARLMLNRRMGLDFSTHETCYAKGDTVARRNFAPMLFQYQRYSGRILHPVKPSASGIRATELFSDIIAGKAHGCANAVAAHGGASGYCAPTTSCKTARQRHPWR